VIESYEYIESEAHGYQNKPKADHDPIIKAGPVRIEWACSSRTNGWLIYHPNRDKVDLLDWKAFDSESGALEKP
jgi:hypothetical protein